MSDTKPTTRLRNSADKSASSGAAKPKTMKRFFFFPKLGRSFEAVSLVEAQKIASKAVQKSAEAAA